MTPSRIDEGGAGREGASLCVRNIEHFIVWAVEPMSVDIDWSILPSELRQCDY